MINPDRPSLISRIVAPFLGGHLAVLLVVSAFAVGAVAVMFTPREEEPQIVVPVADVYVRVPGASPSEVERLVATPLERILWQIDGVEYVYSISQRDQAVVTVRFFVGEDREDSIVKIRDAVASQIDTVPAAVAGWVVKPVEIDDVPILTAALTSTTLDDFALRRIAEELRVHVESLDDLSKTRIVGGRSAQVRIEPDLTALTAHSLTLADIQNAVGGTDASATAGTLLQDGQETTLLAGPFLRDVQEVETLVVGTVNGRLVQLRDVAAVSDGPEEVASYTRFGFGPAGTGEVDRGSTPAVTLAVSKKKGTNAVQVAAAVRARLLELQETLLPDDVEMHITRDTGRTADAKVDELLGALTFAMISVVGLLIFALGWREGLIVALAVPVSFALALFTNMLLGYTINRVTLFALILTLGLVVDDPITNVDNIQRHILKRKVDAARATLNAVAELLPPVILSTLTVVVSFLPMFFITGMMGPYMAPMAGTVPLSVGFSTIAALSIVPWASYRLLRHKGKAEKSESQSTQPKAGAAKTGTKAPKTPRWQKAYRRFLQSFLDSRLKRWGLLGFVLLLLGGSGMLAITGRVPMKMLPFDNKDELQLILDHPEGTTLEQTDATVRAFEDYLRTVPEVTHFQTYSGTYSPIDFNGLSRHYFFRRASHLADIRIHLANKDERAQQSHDLGLRLRDELTAIAKAHGAILNLVESPPGPPVLATVVAEVYGAPDASYRDLAAAAKVIGARMQEEPGLVDVDDTVETQRTRWEFVLDRTKASLHGVDNLDVSTALQVAVGGQQVGFLHREGERQTLPIQLQLPRADRSAIHALHALQVRGPQGGPGIALGEIGKFVERPEELSIYHKNLERVVYVKGEMAGRSPVDAVLNLQPEVEAMNLPGQASVDWSGEGEWKITVRVFRDLGLAFGAALLAIYVLLVIQTRSWMMPLLIMASIPLTAIGILPGFWLLNLLVNEPVGGYATPVFFTATAMIGMIALGGIVVRNSIVLLEFIHNAVAAGSKLEDAIVQSGIMRMRPIVLTAMTTALGAWPITMDPIFSGLAWSLIFGLFASTLFTLVVVPVTYYALFRQRHAA